MLKVRQKTQLSRLQARNTIRKEFYDEKHAKMNRLAIGVLLRRIYCKREMKGEKERVI